MELQKYDFQYRYYTGEGNSFLPVHRIDHRKFFFCVLVHVRSGAYHTSAGGYTYTAYAGETLFIPAGVLHDVFMTEPGVLDWMHFSCRTGSIDVFGNMTQPVVLTDAIAAHCGEACSLMAYYGQQAASVYNSLIQDRTLSCLTADLVARFDISLRVPSSLISQVLLMVQRNISTDLKLRDIANAFNISPSTLERHFQEEMSMSLFEYIRKQRIELACVHLIRTGSATQAANEAGYCDAYYFSRAFKKYMEITPRQYLESIQIGRNKMESQQE